MSHGTEKIWNNGDFAMTDFFLYVTVVLLVFFGLSAVLFKRNLIKIVIALNILEAGVNLFFIVLAYRPEGTAPIFTLAPELEKLRMVLPTPQALILTNIVIGFATTALMLVFAVFIYRNNGTLDIRNLKGVEDHD
jgi:multicomponent Na+:H+ antiporter subunit C